VPSLVMFRRKLKRHLFRYPDIILYLVYVVATVDATYLTLIKANQRQDGPWSSWLRPSNQIKSNQL